MWKHSFPSFSHLFTLPPPHPRCPPTPSTAQCHCPLLPVRYYTLLPVRNCPLLLVRYCPLLPMRYCPVLSLSYRIGHCPCPALPGSCGNILELGWHSTHLDWLRDNGGLTESGACSDLRKAPQWWSQSPLCTSLVTQWGHLGSSGTWRNSWPVSSSLPHPYPTPSYFWFCYMQKISK